MDRAEKGKRREGIYYGLWTFASKTGQALASAAAGWILSLFRYVPLAPVQSPSALLGIRLMAGVIPAFLFLLGVGVHRKFPIDGEAYRRIKERIQGEGEVF
jgi:GPH family glycoside/pentoside/hexuronide:cation symporter